MRKSVPTSLTNHPRSFKVAGAIGASVSRLFMHGRSRGFTVHNDLLMNTITQSWHQPHLNVAPVIRNNSIVSFHRTTPIQARLIEPEARHNELGQSSERVYVRKFTSILPSDNGPLTIPGLEHCSSSSAHSPVCSVQWAS